MRIVFFVGSPVEDEEKEVSLILVNDLKCCLIWPLQAWHVLLKVFYNGISKIRLQIFC